MNPQMLKAVIGAWTKATVEPMIKAAYAASIPAELICGVLVGVAIKVARQASWTDEQIVELVQKSLQPEAPRQG